MIIHFHFTEERFGELTVGAQIAMQDQQQGDEVNFRGLVEMMAPFMQDEEGEWLEFDAACRLLERVKNKELNGVVERFNSAMKEYAVPKGNGNNSISPSTTTEEVPPGSSI